MLKASQVRLFVGYSNTAGQKVCRCLMGCLAIENYRVGDTKVMGAVDDRGWEVGF